MKTRLLVATLAFASLSTLTACRFSTPTIAHEGHEPGIARVAATAADAYGHNALLTVEDVAGRNLLVLRGAAGDSDYLNGYDFIETEDRPVGATADPNRAERFIVASADGITRYNFVNGQQPHFGTLEERVEFGPYSFRAPLWWASAYSQGSLTEVEEICDIDALDDDGTALYMSIRTGLGLAGAKVRQSTDPDQGPILWVEQARLLNESNDNCGSVATDPTTGSVYFGGAKGHLLEFNQDLQFRSLVDNLGAAILDLEAHRGFVAAAAEGRFGALLYLYDDGEQTDVQLAPGTIALAAEKRGAGAWSSNDLWALKADGDVTWRQVVRD